MRRAHHLVAFWRGILKHHLAGVIHHLCYRDGSHAFAFIREDCIRASHLQQAHFAAPKRKR